MLPNQRGMAVTEPDSALHRLRFGRPILLKCKIRNGTHSLGAC